jgi:hypothetical protein
MKPTKERPADSGSPTKRTSSGRKSTEVQPSEGDRTDAEEKYYPGLTDVYLNLLIGPCAKRVITKETKCRLVEEISAVDPDQFDCTHAEWVELFRKDTHQAADMGWPGKMDPKDILSREQLGEAARAQLTGNPIDLEDGGRVESREGEWVAKNPDGSVLIEIGDPSWGYERPDSNPTPHRFPTPEAAIAGYLWARAIDKARAIRNEAAIRRLGHEPPSYD